MYCLKCGKETRGNEVFCGACLEDMEKYPIKPGTAIQLPLRTPRAGSKKPSRRPRSLSPEEQARRLRGMIRRLTATVAILAIALCITAAVLVHTLINQGKGSDIGKNYTAVTGQQP